jgi:hypothetical protein
LRHSCSSSSSSSSSNASCLSPYKNAIMDIISEECGADSLRNNNITGHPITWQHVSPVHIYFAGRNAISSPEIEFQILGWGGA